MNSWLMDLGHVKPNPQWSQVNPAGEIKNGFPNLYNTMKVKFAPTPKKKKALIERIKLMMEKNHILSYQNIVRKLIADSKDGIDNSITDVSGIRYPAWFLKESFDEAMRWLYGDASVVEINAMKVKEMKVSGMTYVEIAKALGCSRTTARQYYNMKTNNQGGRNGISK